MVKYFFIILSFGFLAMEEAGNKYQPQPVDITVKKVDGTFEVSGSSVFQLPDTFVWGGSPVKIDNR